MDYQEANRIATALERIAEMMEHPLHAVQSTETVTAKRVRNEAARCRNCPYSEPFVGDKVACRFEHPDAEHGFPVMPETEVCGNHPDFWNEREMSTCGDGSPVPFEER